MKRVALLVLVCGVALAEDVPPPKKERPGEAWLPTKGRDAPVPVDEWLDLRGIFHAHSKHSHDSTVEPERIVAMANALGLDFFFMTDHPSEKSLTDALRGRRGRTLFFGGAETGGLLALDIREAVKGATGADRIRAVEKQGGIALVAHPEDWTEWDAPFAGMEIANLHYDALKDGPLGEALEKGKGKGGFARLMAALGAASDDPGVKRVFDALGNIDDDPEGPLLAFLDRPAAYLERWDALGKRRRVVGVAGNDSHENVRIAGQVLDPYARTLRLVDTHLLARGIGEKDVREALLAGRAYVAYEVFGDTAGFLFFGRSGGKRVVVLGEETRWSGEDLEVVARTPSDATIRLMRDGKKIAEVEGRELVHRVREGGVYRIEAVVTRRGREVPWILSNPIYVREAD